MRMVSSIARTTTQARLDHTVKYTEISADRFKAF
jgi:hypothetical protein